MMQVLSELPELLVPWFHENKRYMPWREDPTPYHVWVSEIMLQQTRVEAVRPYYDRFLSELPDIGSLSECQEDRLLKLWEGLGYYSRVRNMKKAAEIIMKEYGGVFPTDPKSVLLLPGIGSYTAGAVLSIAFQIPVPVVDGNVLRVISRVSGSERDISEASTKKNMEADLQKVISEMKELPGDFNQALMELGALLCIPNGEPKCMICPLQNRCAAHLTGRTDVLPVKTGKPKREIQKLTVLILRKGRQVALLRRPDSGLLRGMYGFPVISGHVGTSEVNDYLSAHGCTGTGLRPLPFGKHIFTHVEWQMQAYTCEITGGDFIFATEEALETQYALPKAFQKWNIFTEEDT